MKMGLRTEKNILNYERHGIYSIDEVFNMITDENGEIINGNITVDNLRVKANSIRYRLFKEHGVKCKYCGIEGRYFALERGIVNKGNEIIKFHFNLYALDENNNEVLLTKDHIIPKSKGGREYIKNLQTLCETCNSNKSDILEKDVYNIYGLKKIGKYISDSSIDLKDFVKYAEMYNELNDDDKNRISVVVKEINRYKSIVAEKENKKNKAKNKKKKTV